MKVKLKPIALAVVLGCSGFYTQAGTFSAADIRAEDKITDMSALPELDAQSYAVALIEAIKDAPDSELFVQTLLASNKDNANVVYNAALRAGVNEDFIIAAALSSGIDPTSMLAPTAFFAVIPFPPPGGIPPPPPPPPPSPIGGGPGGGGVTISGN